MTAKTVSLRRAIDLLRLPNTRMMEMHDNTSPRGKSYFIVPHGRVDDEDAMKIKARKDSYVFDEGLFPGNPQSWRLG